MKSFLEYHVLVMRYGCMYSGTTLSHWGNINYFVNHLCYRNISGFNKGRCLLICSEFFCLIISMLRTLYMYIASCIIKLLLVSLAENPINMSLRHFRDFSTRYEMLLILIPTLPKRNML